VHVSRLPVGRRVSCPPWNRPRACSPAPAEPSGCSAVRA